ncbi:MAG: twin-arginine translocation signal domain-containing protein [Actinomycetota bacterium]|nr:twin-arginine translocation signal domain-containing protein [Actinomycetota bacterium]
MIGLSRRMFLKRGSMAVAMAGVATSMPLLSEVAAGPAASDAPATSSEVQEGAKMGEALVAHVRDLGSGEMHVFLGERQVVLKDPALARALFRATR